MVDLDQLLKDSFPVFKKDLCINGPFHLDLAISYFFLVFLPWAGFDQGVTEGRPPEDLPSPPP